VHVDVAGRDAGDGQVFGECGEPAVAGAVVAPERALELDAEALALEGIAKPAPEVSCRGGLAARPAPGEGPVPRAPGEADNALGMPLELL
jgi:hypothetical protein